MDKHLLGMQFCGDLGDCSAENTVLSVCVNFAFMRVAKYHRDFSVSCSGAWVA